MTAAGPTASPRALWASGDYAAMVEAFLTPLGQALVDAAGVHPGARVLDVAAGTGNASVPAARLGARVTASDLTHDLLAAGARRPDARGLGIAWVQADAERLPFPDGSQDVVLSSIGVMFAPHHRTAADELVRVCRPGGTVAVLSWTPEGMIGDLFRTMQPFAAAPPPGAQSPLLWGSEEHLVGLLAGRLELRALERDVLRVDVFPRARDYGEYFRRYYGPTIAARARAERDGRAADFDLALDAFCDRWDLGTGDGARFEKEYLLAVGTRR